VQRQVVQRQVVQRQLVQRQLVQRQLAQRPGVQRQRQQLVWLRRLRARYTGVVRPLTRTGTGPPPPTAPAVPGLPELFPTGLG
jgi:hypothetical protein